MSRGGRATQSTGLFPRLLCLCAHFAVGAASDYGIPIEIKLWDTGRTPLAHMVDVTNGFGLKVLAEHNFLNDNNIAFSPYGLMGILVALFEGVDGESSYQIQRGMQLPWNRNVMRIGFRDIHRTLKTYFVPEEGFLAGLALNNENVTFNDSYKKVLRFYGFDLEGDQLPTFPPGTNSTNETSTTSSVMADATTSMSPEAATTAASATEAAPTREEGTTPPTREETTTNPNAETINDVDVRIPDTSTVGAAASNAESTPATNTNVQTTTQAITTEMTTLLTVTTSADVSTAAEISTSTAPVTDSTVPQTVPSTMTPTDEPTSNNEVEAMTTRETNVPLSTMTDATTSTATTISASESTQTESALPTVVTEISTDGTSTTETVDSTTVTESTIESLERRKRSIVDFIFTNPPYIDDYLVYKAYDVDAGLPPINFDDEKMFLANGLRNVQVTYMHYDTILEHAYLPHLEASALRLPLDSDRYYLLVVLPSRGGVPELGRLLSRMARESDLSDVYEALRPRHVRAIVPSFIVKGHVTLTTDLQKLGIRDVFEPRQRDFTPMTRQAGVYVRSIEQAVSVAIRKYRPDDQKKNRYVHNRQPVRFLATYPFLYFVMDSSIHVTLMAGKMVDPLNNRIL